jgi:putative FmdB family regulatory protein
MPLYEYRCEACGSTFEKIQKFSDPPIEVCEVCGKGPVRKLISSPAIQFKGSGWYITDYAKKSSDSGSKKPSDATPAKTDTASKSESSTSTEATKPAKTEPKS